MLERTPQSSDLEEVAAAAFSDFWDDFESDDFESDDFESDDFESDDFESGDDSELEPLDEALLSVA